MQKKCCYSVRIAKTRNILAMLKPILLLIGTIQLSSCSQNTAFDLASDSVILAFGDSLTAGVGVNKKHSYPQKLAQLSGLRVVNSGVSGETTAQGLKRFNRVLEQFVPNLIILLEGGNDILRNIPVAQTKSNLKKMLEIAQEKKIPVILIGVPRKNLFSNSADLYFELADEHRLVLEEEIIGELIKDVSMKSDAVHFNALGYQKLAERVYQLIIDNSNWD
jgi:acyl-CoA thioesterase-1